MADPRFFSKREALTLPEVTALTGARPDGAHAGPFHDVAPLDRAGPSEISFFDNPKYLASFERSQAGACFAHPSYAPRAPKGMTLLLTEQPYVAYALTACAFYPDAALEPAIAPSASVAASAVIGNGVRIDPGAVIGERVTLGNGCWIGANAVLHDGVEIGAGSRIGACCTISHAIIGSRVTIHRGVHIGQDGFGFAPSKTGIVKVPQLGRVLIGDEVEIGSGSCIDRGAGPDTVIGRGAKIDNLVQVGHNVQIGEFAIVVAQVGISGSTRIGAGAMLGGQAGIAGHIRIGSGAKLAAQSGVLGDIPDGATYGGYPAVPIRNWHRQSVALANLIKRRENDHD